MNRNISPVIGLPRAMLYHRYENLWHTFWSELGVQTLCSSPSSRKTLENGTALASDDACVSLKLFLGHVQETGRCLRLHFSTLDQQFWTKPEYVRPV